MRKVKAFSKRRVLAFLGLPAMCGNFAQIVDRYREKYRSNVCFTDKEMRTQLCGYCIVVGFPLQRCYGDPVLLLRV